MIIRSALPHDAEAICDLWNPWIETTTITFTTHLKTPGAIAGQITDAPDAFVVAEDEGRLQGLACFGPFRSGPGYVATAEHSVILSPEARGSGIAAQLMTALEQRAQAAGITTLIAAISGDNAAAITFHERAGFQKTGHMPGVGQKFGRTLDLVWMQKTLPAPD